MKPELILLLGVLAAWRLARDFVNEEGPLGLYGWSRRWLKGFAERRIDASAVNEPHDHPWYWLYDGVDCIVCASFWSSFVVALLIRQAHQPRLGLVSELAELLLWWFGLAGGVLVVERIYKRLEGGSHGSE